jgi:hypothetical protein
MDVQPNVQTDTVIKAFLRSELQLIRSQKNYSVCCLVISRPTTAIYRRTCWSGFSILPLMRV